MKTETKYAATLAAVRTLRGWTQAEMAEKLGKSVRTVGDIEAGRCESRRYVSEVCEVAGVTLGEFEDLLEIYLNSQMRLQRAEILAMAEGE
jgi:transcriptional regulator with XRE-family HTH domain